MCLYVRKDLGCKVREDLVLAENHIETIFVECLINKKNLVIGMIYHRPGTSSEHFFDDLNALLEKINSNCIILGDFNINLISYNNKSINLVNFFREFSFIPCITKPTRVTNNSVSLIDHIWTNIIDDAVIESKIIFSDVSDHFPVVLNLPMTSGCNTY